MPKTKVLIKVGNYFVKETGIGAGYNAYARIADTEDPPPESIFEVDLENIYSGVQIYNSHTKNYMCSRSGRWTVYAMTEDQQDDADKRKWSLSTKQDILRNKDDDNGVCWEVDEGVEVLREKIDDDACETVKFVPIDPSKVTVEVEDVRKLLVANTTDTKQSTMVSTNRRLETKTEIFRERFTDVSAKVTYAWSQKNSAQLPGGPSSETTSEFTAELNARNTWTTRTTQTITNSKSIDQHVVDLNPMTGIALKTHTVTYRLDDKLVLMIDVHDSQVIVTVDSHGNIV